MLRFFIWTDCYSVLIRELSRGFMVKKRQRGRSTANVSADDRALGWLSLQPPEGVCRHSCSIHFVACFKTCGTLCNVRLGYRGVASRSCSLQFAPKVCHEAGLRGSSSLYARAVCTAQQNCSVHSFHVKPLISVWKSTFKFWALSCRARIRVK